MISLVPIVLFAFNRPNHVLKTLQALKKNNLADRSTLYIYCDGPKENSSKSEMDSIEKVRSIIRSDQWCKNIHIIERKNNIGLAESIITGVTEIINIQGSAIVLEDDIVTSPGFLTYMNQALTIYKQEKQVMHISGYMFPIKTDDIEGSTFFYNTASCWGWATWADRWSQLITDPQHIWDELEKRDSFKKFNIGGWANFSKQLRDNIRGIKKTWAVKWYGTIFLNSGYALHPKHSLVYNIGNDESGENSIRTDYYNTDLCDKLNISKVACHENLVIRIRMSDFYFHQKPLKHNILKFLSPLLPKKFTNTPFI